MDEIKLHKEHIANLENQVSDYKDSKHNLSEFVLFYHKRAGGVDLASHHGFPPTYPRLQGIFHQHYNGKTTFELTDYRNGEEEAKFG